MTEALDKLKKLQEDAPTLLKKPRVYADEIINIKCETPELSRIARREALEKVPEIYRDLVKKHVQNAFMLNRRKP